MKNKSRYGPGKKICIENFKAWRVFLSLCSIECGCIDTFQVSPESIVYCPYCINRFCHMLSESSHWLIVIFRFSNFEGKMGFIGYIFVFRPCANARAAARSFSSGLPLLIPPMSFKGPNESHPLQQNSSTMVNPWLTSFSFRAA